MENAITTKTHQKLDPTFSWFIGKRKVHFAVAEITLIRIAATTGFAGCQDLFVQAAKKANTQVLQYLLNNCSFQHPFPTPEEIATVTCANFSSLRRMASLRAAWSHVAASVWGSQTEEFGFGANKLPYT